MESDDNKYDPELIKARIRAQLERDRVDAQEWALRTLAQEEKSSARFGLQDWIVLAILAIAILAIIFWPVVP